MSEKNESRSFANAVSYDWSASAVVACRVLDCLPYIFCVISIAILLKSFLLSQHYLLDVSFQSCSSSAVSFLINKNSEGSCLIDWFHSVLLYKNIFKTQIYTNTSHCTRLYNRMGVSCPACFCFFQCPCLTLWCFGCFILHPHQENHFPDSFLLYYLKSFTHFC